MGLSKDVNGTWDFIKREGGAIVIRGHWKDASEGKEIRVEFLDDDHIELPAPDILPLKQKLSFERVTIGT